MLNHVLTKAGGVHSYDSYGTTLLIAGGIGITNPISYLRELVNGFVDRSVATRRITLLWVVRSVGMFLFFSFLFFLSCR